MFGEASQTIVGWKASWPIYNVHVEVNGVLILACIILIPDDPLIFSAIVKWKAPRYWAYPVAKAVHFPSNIFLYNHFGASLKPKIKALVETSYRPHTLLLRPFFSDNISRCNIITSQILEA